MLLFFFSSRRRHTRCSRDWSSDVCSSDLFGSNTPGALINFINRTGGPEVRGTLKAYGGTGDYARTDFNVNGPVGPDWRVNIGGFYRDNRGARGPGVSGTGGGQVKAHPIRDFTNRYIPA